MTYGCIDLFCSSALYTLHLALDKFGNYVHFIGAAGTPRNG